MPQDATQNSGRVGQKKARRVGRALRAGIDFRPEDYFRVFTPWS